MQGKSIRYTWNTFGEKLDGENCKCRKVIVIFKGQLSSKGVALLVLMKLGPYQQIYKKARKESPHSRLFDIVAGTSIGSYKCKCFGWTLPKE